MLQERIVVWGTNDVDEKVLVGINFSKENFEVKVYLIPGKNLKTPVQDSIINNWSAGEDVELPKNTKVIPRPLSEETLLPDEIKVKETFIYNQCCVHLKQRHC